MLALPATLCLAACTSGPPPTPARQPLTVVTSTANDLVGGARVTVEGRDFDTSKGIYVAYCVEPESGYPPTPCGGGVDNTGDSGASAWISSNPPPYGKDLVEPYGPDGTFTTAITVSPRIGSIDCRRQVCGIATRADHTRSADRSQDTFTPVTFKENK